MSLRITTGTARCQRGARRLVAVLALLVAAGALRAEEIWLCDNTRLNGWVRRVTPQGGLGVLLPTGEERELALGDVVGIRFLGRNPLLVQAGAQEFRLLDGDRLRGQIIGSTQDLVRIQTAISGIQDLDLRHFKGFLSLPQAGFIGRKAEDLVESAAGRRSPHVDMLLDEGGGEYPGVVRHLERTLLAFDVDDFLQVRPFPIQYVRGVRLADAGRTPPPAWRGEVRVLVWTRDGSLVRGQLAGVYLGRWRLSPAWDPAATIEIDPDEISLVQVLGGRVQYLSQLAPVSVKESTTLAPPQPSRMDQNTQGGPLSIAGRRYPWGLGMHANATMTFDLGGRYREFQTEAGIDTRSGDRGSVRFAVWGDGRELFRSSVVRGADHKPLPIRVPIDGVKLLALEVADADDLDLGDMADWGSARVLKDVVRTEAPPAAAAAAAPAATPPPAPAPAVPAPAGTGDRPVAPTPPTAATK